MQLIAPSSVIFKIPSHSSMGFPRFSRYSIVHNNTFDLFMFEYIVYICVDCVFRCGVPFSCCKEEYQDNRHCGYGSRDTSKLTPQERTTKLSVINTIGCVERAKLFVSSKWALIGGVAVGFFVLLLLSMFLANSLREEIMNIKEGHR